jgi:hypothetical protein
LLSEEGSISRLIGVRWRGWHALREQTSSGEKRTYDILFDRFWCGGREGASGFSFWIERQMVALEGHEEDIVKQVSGK